MAAERRDIRPSQAAAADPGAADDRASVARLVLELDGVEATEALGEALGALAEAGDVIALEGELGAGKTAMVRGIARGLGAGDDVASPTYILMDAHHGGRLPLFHFDAWMEGREKALFFDGGDEWLRAGGVAVVEWAGRVDAWLPRPRLAVVLEHVSPAARRATLTAVGGPEAAAGLGARPGTRPGEWGPRLARLDPLKGVPR
jgi:tRNA threonylcarbamoyladenosine biosynthesis protein TsaE